MHTTSPPVTEDDLRIALHEFLEHSENPPPNDPVGRIAQLLIRESTWGNEYWFATGVMILASFRRHAVRRDATRLLLRLAAECELQSEGG